jgi:hypothetical protein
MEMESLQTKPIITSEDLYPEFTDDLIFTFENITSSDLENGVELDFNLRIKSHSIKKTPILQLAKPEEAKDIKEIFEDAYKNTYLYKDYTDEQSILKMIKDPNFHWILFKIKSGVIVGCYGFQLDYNNKSATFHGFALKRNFQSQVDVLKIILGCTYSILKTYKNKILQWSCEIRTAHSISQYMGIISGLYPIAFFPNKDVFFNKVESCLLFIMYDESVFQEFQSKEVPKVILEAANCYLYSKLKYHLGDVEFKNPEIKLDLKKVNKIKKEIKIKKSSYNLTYQRFILFMENSDSIFEFNYSPEISNCEKTKYHVKNLEELWAFLNVVHEIIKKYHIRYFECFISTQVPEHQKLFLDAGFTPSGYIPSWKYNKDENAFEDQIVFIHSDNKCENIQLIPESLRLLDVLNITIGMDSKVI